MIYASIVLFCLAAIIGTYLITKVVGGRPISKNVITIHSIFAFTGLILLIIYIIQLEIISYYLLYSVGLFLLAGILGFFALKKYKPEERRPQVLALLHALMAVGGLMMLFVYTAIYL